MLCMKFLKLSVLFVSSNLFWSSVVRDCSPVSGENTAYNVNVKPYLFFNVLNLILFNVIPFKSFTKLFEKKIRILFGI